MLWFCFISYERIWFWDNYSDHTCPPDSQHSRCVQVVRLRCLPIWGDSRRRCRICLMRQQTIDQLHLTLPCARQNLMIYDDLRQRWYSSLLVACQGTRAYPEKWFLAPSASDRRSTLAWLRGACWLRLPGCKMKGYITGSNTPSLCLCLEFSALSAKVQSNCFWFRVQWRAETILSGLNYSLKSRTYNEVHRYRPFAAHEAYIGIRQSDSRLWFCQSLAILQIRQTSLGSDQACSRCVYLAGLVAAFQRADYCCKPKPEKTHHTLIYSWWVKEYVTRLPRKIATEVHSFILR